jgi:hypothetical protein
MRLTKKPVTMTKTTKGNQAQVCTAMTRAMSAHYPTSYLKEAKKGIIHTTKVIFVGQAPFVKILEKLGKHDSENVGEQK